MSTKYTLKVGQYVWAIQPKYEWLRLCIIKYLYSRGKNENMARVQAVCWSPVQSPSRSFLVPVSELKEATPTEKQLADLDKFNKEVE